MQLAVRLAMLVVLATGCDQPELPLAPPATAFPSASRQLPVLGANVCYATELGVWEPAVEERDFWFWQIPQTVKLTTRKAWPDSEYLVIEPIAYDEQLQKKQGMWQLQGDHLFVSWSEGFTSVSAKLVPGKGGLSGIAETFEDGNPAFHRHAPLTLKQTPCGRGQ